MDPASAAITFGGAALAAAKFAKELNRAYVHFKMFDDDIENLATEFDVFADTVETFRFSFKCVCEEHPTLTVLGWITKQGLVSKLVAMSRCIYSRIQTAAARFKRVARNKGYCPSAVRSGGRTVTRKT